MSRDSLNYPVPFALTSVTLCCLALLRLINWPETFCRPPRLSLIIRSFHSRENERESREEEGRRRRGQREADTGHDAAGQQNETRDNLLAPSYKAEATAGPIHTRLLCGNKARRIEVQGPFPFAFVLFYSSPARRDNPRVQWQLGIPFFTVPKRPLFADVFKRVGRSTIELRLFGDPEQPRLPRRDEFFNSLQVRLYLLTEKLPGRSLGYFGKEGKLLVS